MKNFALLTVIHLLGVVSAIAAPPLLSSPSTSPDGRFVIHYTPGVNNPNAGQDGFLELNPGGLSLASHTIGIQSIEVHWRPDSGAVVVLEHFGRTDTLVAAEHISSGWQLYRNPAVKAQLSALGSQVGQVSREQTTFVGWDWNRANFTLSLQYRDGEFASFSYSLNFPGATVQGWKQKL